jgi:hypothetical protein
VNVGNLLDEADVTQADAQAMGSPVVNDIQIY